MERMFEIQTVTKEKRVEIGNANRRDDVTGWDWHEAGEHCYWGTSGRSPVTVSIGTKEKQKDATTCKEGVSSGVEAVSSRLPRSSPWRGDDGRSNGGASSSIPAVVDAGPWPFSTGDRSSSTWAIEPLFPSSGSLPFVLS